MSADPPSHKFCTLVCNKSDECVKECNSLLDFIKQDQDCKKSLTVPGEIYGQTVSAINVMADQSVVAKNLEGGSRLYLGGDAGSEPCAWIEGQACPFHPPQED